jgi:ABC-type glycerol-3-phosphate transport system substrate-binding protein
MRTTRRLLVLTLVAALALAACGDDDDEGGGGDTTTTTTEATTTTTIDEEAAKAEITTAWEGLLDGTKTLDERVAYLEDGEELKALAEQQFQILGEQASASSGKVKDIVFEDDGTATVTYDILLNDVPALEDSVGTAVQVDGEWKFSKLTMCDLLALAGQSPEECADVGT